MPSTRGDALSLSAQSNSHIEFYGLHSGARGWIFGTKLSRRWPTSDEPEITAHFEFGNAVGIGSACFFNRRDFADDAYGLLLFLPSPDTLLGLLQTLEIRVAGEVFLLRPAENLTLLDETQLIGRVATILANADPTSERDRLTTLLRRRAFSGSDTTSSLSDFLRVGIDAAIPCPPDGMLLTGWLLAAPETVHTISLCCGTHYTPLQPERSLRLDRPDVLKTFPDTGLTDRRCGFLVYVPDVGKSQEASHLEIETRRGEIGYVPLRPARTGGMHAIKHLLALFEIRYEDIGPAFDTVIGPSIRAINKSRLSEPTTVSVADFGGVDPAPLYSVIIPLYGCIDFMEYQLAFFSRQDHAGHEFIYVLDDPDQDRATRRLAESAYERFRVPFRLVTLDRNLGYAPANNIGLKMAHADTVCFMNSDVFPSTNGWMAGLAARLDEDPTLGAVGPLLLFDDGSVQHQGIEFEAVPQFGNWMFPHHVGKGWRPEADGGLRHCRAITAACLVMRTRLARALNGFDEDFIIGDFEDTDLCLRLARHGLTCAIDHDVQLIHLERKSQSPSTAAWRMNLTLYNAWLHQRRWFAGGGLPAELPPAARANANGHRRSQRR